MISDVISTALFTDNRVNIPVLKQRAYNHRWAVQEADIIPLTAADPDFPIAPQIVAGMQNYLQKGYLSYGPPTGLPEFCEGVAETLQRKRVLTCEADQIFAVNSAASALFLVAKFALNNPGDEALIADPVDFLFERSVVAAGGRVKRFSLNGGGQGTFDPDEIEALITSGKTKLLSICNPHNPLGRVWTRDELLQLADIAVRHNLWIMSDEVWADIVYQPHHHT
ncbi:MAG: pyridoxal phosphate-dependent aminotransferase, partial [Chloroflexota bacterium]